MRLVILRSVQIGCISFTLAFAACTSLQVEEDDSLANAPTGLLGSKQGLPQQNDEYHVMQSLDGESDRSQGLGQPVVPEIQSNNQALPFQDLQAEDYRTGHDLSSVNRNPVRSDAAHPNSPQPRNGEPAHQDGFVSLQNEPSESERLKNTLEAKKAELLARAEQILKRRSSQPSQAMQRQSVRASVTSRSDTAFGSGIANPKGGLVKPLPRSVARLVEKQDLPQTRSAESQVRPVSFSTNANSPSPNMAPSALLANVQHSIEITGIGTGSGGSGKLIGAIQGNNLIATLDKIKISVKASQAVASGKVTLSHVAGGVATSKTESMTTQTRDFDGIELKNGSNVFTVTWNWEDAQGKQQSATSNSVIIVQDKIGPRCHNAIVVDDPSKGKELVVSFLDDDLPALIDNKSFKLIRQDQSGAFQNAVSSFTAVPVRDGNRVRIALPTGLPSGMYQLQIYATKKTNKVVPLVDELGNSFSATSMNTDADGTYMAVQVQVHGGRLQGQHVAFPQWTPPKNNGAPKNGFNPGDFVETRTARLYYFRDAHRVAQIINRNIRSLNQAAVEQAQRRAESSRDRADTLTDDRRAYERDAVRAAEQARNAENTLFESRRALQTVQESEIKVNEIDIEVKDVDSRITEIKGVEASINTKQRDIAAANSQLLQARKAAGDALAELELKTSIHANKQLEFETKIGRGEVVTDNERNAVNSALIERSDAEKLYQKLLADQNSALNLVAQYEQQLREYYSVLNALENPDSKEDLERLKTRLLAEKKVLSDVLTNFGTTETLSQRIPSLEQAVANLRQTAIQKQEAAIAAQAKEDRARENQFRQEVTAAKEDPDTYVAGDIHSVDPITQCSLSVIGEGLIQIRGPIKGINKIRTLINQIDSPLGQIKIGINTVQVNGEKANRMERVVSRIEGHIDLGRFLTSQSLLLLRKAIQETAAMVASQHPDNMHMQEDRDRKYLYSFFGRDFIDELYAMDSEFLHSENKILSLHSMDTISLNRALFILALAKNDIRQHIMERFMEMVRCDLPQIEWDFRRSSELTPHKTRMILPMFDKEKHECHTLEGVTRKVKQRYHFRNVRGFFDTGFVQSDTMNPMQREFIRLAQIFKSQMIAEVELKQRVIERALIEDPSTDEALINDILKRVHRNKSLPIVEESFGALVDSHGVPRELIQRLNDQVGAYGQAISLILEPAREIYRISQEYFSDEVKEIRDDFLAKNKKLSPAQEETLNSAYSKLVQRVAALFPKLEKDAFRRGDILNSGLLSEDERDAISNAFDMIEWIKDFEPTMPKNPNATELKAFVKTVSYEVAEIEAFKSSEEILEGLEDHYKGYRKLRDLIDQYLQAIYKEVDLDLVNGLRRACINAVENSDIADQLLIVQQIDSLYNRRVLQSYIELDVERAEYIANRTRAKLDHKKLLDFLIDEHEEKYIELVEGTRAHIATIDNYLKRLAIALEDDFKLQFYDPAWKLIRMSATEYDVSLGQVERTTILTNNRAFAKVSPQATMEFDLPKRKIAIVEALDGAKALAEDYGALLNDPTFLASFQMMGGAKQASTVKNLLPGLPTSTDQQILGHVPSQARQSDSSLQSLVPDPEIYKFETGTGFEIRPVIQPDGDSVIYDFNYMYTTNVREPIAADEKHLGRIKRHFIDTQVQTSSFELREISRYQVALKAARTSKGVPLLEDIPVAGALFRPAPSDESALQQNIILGSSTVYPTLFDLMGLRWAPQIVELDHARLLNSAHVIRGRREVVKHHVFQEGASRFDKFLQIRRLTPEQHRPDLYHPQRAPSIHHPNGYSYPSGFEGIKAPNDPTGKHFQRFDKRPTEYRQPSYDSRRHTPIGSSNGGDVIYGYPVDESYSRPGVAPTNDPRDAEVIMPGGSSRATLPSPQNNYSSRSGLNSAAPSGN